MKATYNSGMIAAAVILGFISAPQNIHGAITREAAKDLGFSKDALDRVVDANFRQDYDEIRFEPTPGKPWFVPNAKYRPEHHFDRNEGDSHEFSFDRGTAYVLSQERAAIDALRAGKTRDALISLGKAAHAFQDFFAHSNFIDLPKGDQTSVLKGSFAAALRITGYSKTGQAIPGDDYSHDAFCKDGSIDLKVRVVPQGESAAPHPDGRNKHEVARRKAEEATLKLLMRFKSQSGGDWVTVANYKD